MCNARMLKWSNWDLCTPDREINIKLQIFSKKKKNWALENIIDYERSHYEF